QAMLRRLHLEGFQVHVSSVDEKPRALALHDELVDLPYLLWLERLGRTHHQDGVDVIVDLLLLAQIKRAHLIDLTQGVLELTKLVSEAWLLVTLDHADHLRLPPTHLSNQPTYLV